MADALMPRSGASARAGTRSWVAGHEEPSSPWRPTLQRLCALWRLFARCGDTAKLAQQMVESLAETFRAERVSMMLRGADGSLTITAAVGLPREVVAETRVLPGEGIAGWVARTGQPLLLPDGHGIPAPLREVVSRDRLASALCVPLLADGRVLGVLNVARLRGRPHFTPGHLAFASLLAERAAVAFRVAHMEAELNQASKMAALGVMAAGVAHELRAPLSIIAAASQLLSDCSDDPDLRVEALQRIAAALRRAAHTIDGLLTLARPTTDHWEPVDVNALVEDVLHLFTPHVSGQKIGTRMALVPVPPVWANRNLLQQVFTNILANAATAMPQGGVLTVATGAEPRGGVEIRFTT